MQSNILFEILLRVQQGSLDVALAVEELRNSLPTAETEEAKIDLDRARRCGFPEVIYGPGKSIVTLLAILETQFAAGEDCLATRVDPDQAAAVRQQFPDSIHNVRGRTLRWMQPGGGGTVGKVVVVTAGTSDLAVADEACETLRWMRCGVDLIVDVGVAGPQRLREQLPRFQGADAVVVVAGMEGALPSVVGGYVPCPVVAVPTSVGYGANFGGVSALLGMLNSCASNVTVVNIDAGFKGGYVAGLIARNRAGSVPQG